MAFSTRCIHISDQIRKCVRDIDTVVHSHWGGPIFKQTLL